jgi:predicted HicB family RNase H-like nuclease
VRPEQRELIAVPDDRNPETLAVIHPMPTEFRKGQGHAMATKPKVKYVVGPDLDLDKEEFILNDGRRLTNELAEQIAEETLAEVRRRNLIPGGKSLSGAGAYSPRVQFRVPQDLREQAERVAEDEGVSLSALARHALEDYLRSRAS